MADLLLTDLATGDMVGVWHYHAKPKVIDELLTKDLAFLEEVTINNSVGKLMLSKRGRLYDSRSILLTDIHAYAMIRVRNASSNPILPFELITENYVSKNICSVIRIDDTIITVK